MSIYFVTADGHDIWNPGSLTARLFHDQVEAVARVLGIDAGLAPIRSDEVIVDEEQFKAFAQACGRLVLASNASSGARALLEPCLAIAAALAERLGAPPPGEPTLVGLLARGREIVGGPGPVRGEEA